MFALLIGCFAIEAVGVFFSARFSFSHTVHRLRSTPGPGAGRYAVFHHVRETVYEKSTRKSENTLIEQLPVIKTMLMMIIMMMKMMMMMMVIGIAPLPHKYSYSRARPNAVTETRRESEIEYEWEWTGKASSLFAPLLL